MIRATSVIVDQTTDLRTRDDQVCVPLCGSSQVLLRCGLLTQVARKQYAEVQDPELHRCHDSWLR